MNKIITFSGVDGAGKTTILRHFISHLEIDCGIKCVEIRQRPSILPILSSFKYGKVEAEKKSMNSLPRTGTNKSKLSSFIRLAYYLLDYILGQWYIYFKYTRRNIFVVYDRYFFDFMIDPKRMNINLNTNFIKFFYKFIFSPEINIFLYASPEVVLSRKKELDKKTILTLTNNYMRLFKSLKSENEKYICIENLDIEHTLSIIIKEK